MRPDFSKIDYKPAAALERVMRGPADSTEGWLSPEHIAIKPSVHPRRSCRH